MPVTRTVADLRDIVKKWHADGLKVGLVPTMGALHHGHLSLVNEIASKVDKIIVSIFVNPAQFGENEDLSKYPRQETEDRSKLTETQADLVFAPSVSEMYPDGFETKVAVPKLGKDYEGVNRPGHFEGVATVVTKLILQSHADVAIFGEKDYQQLAVIRRFVKDLNISCEIMGGTLVRENDGLAASSRNVYLSPKERETAGSFNKILKQLVIGAEVGKNLRKLEQDAASELLKAGFTKVDYVSIVDKDTLLPIDKIKGEARVISVARFGNVRLLDNMAINSKE
ncbi:pantoate--beta-alanine ligase [Kordiimonas sp. SCSIO 12610]|nr:pantoate--beta-alanine ligase [Kordiimonas sp. SCSIO 12610]